MAFTSFWILPLVSAATWLAMLLAMLLKWVTDGSPHYPSMSPNQHIAYISDIGAQYLQPLFIAGSVVTVVTLDGAFVAERWLRHRGILVRNASTSERVLSGLAIVCAVAGAAGLILLSIFDTLHHPKLHDGFLLLFMGGYVLAAAFTCAEYQRLGVHQRQHRILRVSFWIKLAFVAIELCLGAAFAGLTFSSHQQTAAIFEWVVAAIFTFWVLSFFLDLLPAVRRWHHSGAGDAHVRVEMAMGKEDTSGAASLGVLGRERDGPPERYGTPPERYATPPPASASRQHERHSRGSTLEYGDGAASPGSGSTEVHGDDRGMRIPIGKPQENGDGAGLAPGDKKYLIR